MSFSGQVKKFSQIANSEAEKVFRGTALGMFAKIVQRTPVDTGRLRGNWQSSIGAPSKAVEATGEGYEATVGRLKLGDKIYFMNNLPYALAIERGHGVKNRPGGMVAVTVREYKRIVSQQAKR